MNLKQAEERIDKWRSGTPPFRLFKRHRSFKKASWENKKCWEEGEEAFEWAGERKVLEYYD